MICACWLLEKHRRRILQRPAHKGERQVASSLSRILVVVLVLVATARVAADQLVSSEPINVEGQPVTITSCSAQQFDKDGIANKRLSVNADLTNNSSKAVAYVSMKIIFLDVAGNTVDSRSFSRAVSLGANGNGSISFAGLRGFLDDSVTLAKCYISRITFSDESHWKPPSQP
jgi:ribosomal protein S4